MTLSLKIKKWGKRVLIVLLALIVVAGGTIHYLIAFRFREIIRYIVNKESKGEYSFGASKIDVSVWKRYLVVNNAQLRCNDTLGEKPHYDLTLPKVYLKIHSWSDLLLRKKLGVDSLTISTPDLKAHNVHREKEQHARHISFHATKVIGMLEKLTAHLEVRSFHLEDGAFAMAGSGGNAPFISNKINLLIHNFSKKNKRSEHVLSADDIDFSIKDQHWNLPGGKSEFVFKKLHFSGRGQFFELDTCTFKSTNESDTTGISVSADKIFFNSTQLTALYEKEELIIDTLLLVHPVLSAIKKEKKKNADEPAVSITDAVRKLFKVVHIGYIDIDDGQLLLGGKNSTQAVSITDRTDLKIYNFNINDDRQQLGVTADSIQARLKNIHFITKDSLFELAINDFTIQNNDIYFKQVAFSPTVRNRFKNFDFRAPGLHLTGVGLEDLLDKRLTATRAELYDPVIHMVGRRKEKSKTDTTVAIVAAGQGKLDNFYKAIHGLAELIAVDTFRIVNGDMKYEAPGHLPIQVSMKKINGDILLRQFLKSDSIIDIKHSMPALKIALTHVHTPKMELKVTDYLFNGLVRDNYASAFDLTLADHSNIKGKLVAWQELDWDSLLYSKRIDLDAIQVQELEVDMQLKEKRNTSQSKKDLRPMIIRRLDIGSLRTNVTKGGKQVIHFTGSEICMDKINSVKRSFAWDIVLAKIANIYFDNGKMTITAAGLNVDNEHETVLAKAKVNIVKENGDFTKLDIPVLRIAAAIKSNNSAGWVADSVTIEKPLVSLYAKSAADPEKSKQNKEFKIPIDLLLKKLDIVNGTIQFARETGRDTTNIRTGINLHMRNLALLQAGEKLLGYDTARLAVSDLDFDKKGLEISLPRSSLILTNGHLTRGSGIVLNSGVVLEWADANVVKSSPGKSALTLKKISGSFLDDHFRFSPAQKIKWQSVINHTAIHDAQVDFANNNLTAHAGSIRWSPSQKEFMARSFRVQPNYQVGDTLPDKTRQVKTVSFEGESLSAGGIAFQHQPGDSSLVVRKVVLDKVIITASKDKRIPEMNVKEKPMFSHLVNSVKIPFHVDSLLMRNSTVIVHETSPKTEKQGTIPLQGLYAVATNIKNRDNQTDSFYIVAHTSLFNNHIRHFRYSEAYGDSLASFALHVTGSPMVLTAFNKVTHPLASINVVSGNSDTLFASWTGNKYAAIGKMDFYYKDLRIQLLDKKNPEKKKLLLSIENFLANKILLNRRNTRTAVVFFERDNSKSVFNYWVKTSMSGLMTSAGIKRNKKYYKQYNKLREKYVLPDPANR